VLDGYWCLTASSISWRSRRRGATANGDARSRRDQQPLRCVIGVPSISLVVARRSGGWAGAAASTPLGGRRAIAVTEEPEATPAADASPVAPLSTTENPNSTA
jgi:hypothetical protein